MNCKKIKKLQVLKTYVLFLDLCLWHNNAVKTLKGASILKISIVGCGNIAQTHANALIQQNQDIVLVVGRNLKKTKDFAQKWNIPAYSTRFEEALGDNIDCVHICTPPALHYEMVKAALLAGKHVICEKPLCLKSEQAHELYLLAKEKKLLAAVNFNVRYHEACQRAKKVVSSPEFGTIPLSADTADKR